MEVKTLRNVFKQKWPLGFQKHTYCYIELVQQFTNTWRHKNKFNNNRFRNVPYNSALCFLFLCWTTSTHGGDKQGLEQDKKKGQYLERSEPEEFVFVGVES